MSRRTLFVALACAASACQPSSRERWQRVAPEWTAEGANASAAVSSLLGAVRQRLQGELAPPSAQTSLRCPDESLPHADAEQSTLLLRVRDARLERKNILPLDLLRSLAPDVLESDLEAGALSSLAKRRYLGELVVEGYSAPYNFRRLEALHSEWSAGKLDARLVVYDLETRAVLCIAPVHVRGDATGAALSRRLRESTRNDLTRKLHGQALREMGVALSGMSRVLRLPEAEPLLVSRRDGV